MSHEDSYQERFLGPDDAEVFDALDMAERINADLEKAGPLGAYLKETRAAAILAMSALEVCEPTDVNAIVKCQADIRAYRRVREWISAKMQAGDAAYVETLGNAHEDDHIPSPEDFIEIPE